MVGFGGCIGCDGRYGVKDEVVLVCFEGIVVLEAGGGIFSFI